MRRGPVLIAFTALSIGTAGIPGWSSRIERISRVNTAAPTRLQNYSLYWIPADSVEGVDPGPSASRETQHFALWALFPELQQTSG